MITISARALTWLSRIETPDGRVLRLEPQGNRTLGLTFGHARLRDQVVRRDGHDVICIPKLVSDTLDGATLDLDTVHEDGDLILMPPA